MGAFNKKALSNVTPIKNHWFKSRELRNSLFWCKRISGNDKIKRAFAGVGNPLKL